MNEELGRTWKEVVAAKVLFRYFLGWSKENPEKSARIAGVRAEI
jgi:hypothetical protein